MRTKNLKLGLLLSLLLLWCPAISYSQTISAETPNSKTIPIEQWNELKRRTNLLEANLLLLRTELITLDEQSQEVNNLLERFRQELLLTESELNDANNSLKTVSLSLKKTESLYVELEKQIQTEREEALERERAAYRKGWLNGFCVGLGVGALIIAR